MLDVTSPKPEYATDWHALIHGDAATVYTAPEDRVLFSAYSPLGVPVACTFPLHIWAYTRLQEEEARVRATEKGDVLRGNTRHELLV